MNSCYLFAMVEHGIVKSILRDLQRRLFRDNLDRLDHSFCDLVLETRVLALADLTHHHHVEIPVTRLDSRHCEAM